MANETTTTSLAAVIQTWIEKSAYPLLAYNVVLDTYARLVPLPSGNTIRVPLLMPHSVVKTNIDETAGTPRGTAQLIPQYVEKAIEFFGADSDITKKAAKSSLIDALRYARGQLEQQAARSINRRYAKAISSQLGMRWTPVFATTGYKSLMTVKTGTNTTTQLKATTLLPAAKIVGGQVFFLTGKCAGQGRRITSMNTTGSILSFASTGTFGQPAFFQAMTAGDTFQLLGLVSLNSIASYTFELSDAFRMAEQARRAGAQGFTPGGRVREDGFGYSRNVAGTVAQMALFIDTQIALDLQMSATTNGYTDVFKQTEDGISRWSKGQFGLINNISFIGHNEGWRMTPGAGKTLGAESDTGLVHTPTLVGADSYLATKFRGVGNERGGLEFRVKSPGTQTFSVYHESILYRIEWDAWMAVLTQNGMHGAVMPCCPFTAKP